MKFCILVVHDLTNDISHDAKLNSENIAILGVKYSKFRGKIARNGKIFVVSIFFNILVQNVAQWYFIY